MEDVCKRCFDTYHELLEMGVAKETARSVIPMATYTEFYFKMDLHNLLRFLRLRMDEHAQFEIQRYAKAIYELIEPIVPHTLKAFNTYQWNSLNLSEKDINAIREGKKEVTREDGFGLSERKEYKDKLGKLNLFNN